MQQKVRSKWPKEISIYLIKVCGLARGSGAEPCFEPVVRYIHVIATGPNRGWLAQTLRKSAVPHSSGISMGRSGLSRRNSSAARDIAWFDSGLLKSCMKKYAPRTMRG